MPISFDPMNCRLCGNAINPFNTTVQINRVTQSFADCNYVCQVCRVGYSNSQTEASRTMIYANHLENLPNGPDALRTDLERCLANAANVRNRDNKRNKFAFATSEDALTWSVFWYLSHTNQICHALGDRCVSTTALLLWGCPINDDPSGLTTLLHQIQVNELGEAPNSKSEPDVIIETESHLYFIESKYGSPNSCKPEYRHWDTYLRTETIPLFGTPQIKIQQAGFEELTRNWVIGNMIANRINKRFELINLGPCAIEASSNQFAELINQTDADYRFLSWTRLMDKITIDDWFREYLNSKF